MALIAIIIKVILYLHFFQLEGDKLFQALGAKSLVEGRGLTFQHVLASDLSTQLTEAVNRWPIAYSLLLAPFYWLTGNMEAACVIVDVISICFFFIAFFKLLQILQLRQFLINAIILFAGAMFGPSLSKPTDLLACAGLVYTCLLFIVFVSDRLKPRSFGIAIGAAVIIPAAFRYMYVPCIFIIPSLLLWIGYRRKDLRIESGGVYAVVAAAILFLALVGLQKITVGKSTYLMGVEKGFFPENLLSLYPFIPDAFLDINFTLQQTTSITGVSFVFLFTCLRYINLVLFAIVLYEWITFVSRGSQSRDIFDSFLLLTGVISGTIILLLACLSLTNSSAAIPLRIPFAWTFIGDGRYFLFPVTILPVVAAYYLFNKQWPTLGRLREPLKYFFFALIFFQVTHTLYFIVKRFDPLGLTGGNVLITRPGESYLRSRIKEYKQRGYNVMLTGTDETVSNWASLNGNNGILHVGELLSADIHPKKRSIVFVVVARNMLPSVGEILAQKNFVIEKQIAPMTIFSKEYASP